jgi:hypothetical protein
LCTECGDCGLLAAQALFANTIGSKEEALDLLWDHHFYLDVLLDAIDHPLLNALLSHHREHDRVEEGLFNRL